MMSGGATLRQTMMLMAYSSGAIIPQPRRGSLRIRHVSCATTDL
jgi:hypothetical protein